MKKSIIALMGLFTLVACSEDSYQEADKMSNNQTGNVDNSSGGMQTNSIDVNIPYESPFNGYGDGIDIPYTITNASPYAIDLIGYFGMTYYDGIDDADWFGFYDLRQPEFSMLYQNSNEYLNLVSSSVTSFPPTSTSVLADMRCPSIGTSPSVLNPTGAAFTVDGQLFPFPANGTGEEGELIHQNGKLYYLDVFIPSINYSTKIKVKFGNDMMDYSALTSLSSDWDLIGSNIPGISGDLVYNLHTQEICLANDSLGNGLISEDSFVDPRTGLLWYIRAYTDASGVYIEVTP